MSHKRNMTAIVLLSPTLIVLLAVIAVPTLWTLYLSFTEFSPGTTPRFVGLANYTKVVAAPEFRNAVINNVLLVITVIFLQLAVALLLSFLLYQRRRLKKLLVMIAIAPYAVAPVSSVVVWKYMFNPNYGIINYGLTLLGFEPIMWLGTPATALIAVIVALVWKGYPFQFLLTYSSLLSVPTELIDAAGVDGASRLQVTRYVTLPIMMPAIRVGLVFQTVFLLRAFDIPWTLTEGGPGRATEILSIYLYRTGYRYYRFGEASAIAWIMLLVTFAIAARMIWKVYRSSGVMN